MCKENGDAEIKCIKKYYLDNKSLCYNIHKHY